MIERTATIQDPAPGTAPGVTLSPDARRTQIVDWLDREGEVGVEVMADRFGVSGMTIRRDLQGVKVFQPKRKGHRHV